MPLRSKQSPHVVCVDAGLQARIVPRKASDQEKISQGSWICGQLPDLISWYQISPTMTDAKSRQRLLLLCTTTGYQTQAFVEAAEKLRLAVVFATDRCHVLEDPWQDGALPLRFEDPEAGAQRIAEYARTNPIAALVSIGSTETGARLALPIFEPIINAVWSENIAPKAPLNGPSPEAQAHLIDLPI